MGPFHYNYFIFVLVRWEPIVDEDYPWTIPFWVEPVGVPVHLGTAGNLNRIGDKLGFAHKVDVSMGNILVDIDSRRPLKVTRKLKSKDGELTIQLKYDMLFKHCLYYHLLTHEVAYCEKKAMDIKAEAAKTNALVGKDLDRKPGFQTSKESSRSGAYNKMLLEGKDGRLNVARYQTDQYPMDRYGNRNHQNDRVIRNSHS